MPTHRRRAAPGRATATRSIFFNFRPDRARQLTLAFSRPGLRGVPGARVSRPHVRDDDAATKRTSPTRCSSGRARSRRRSARSSPRAGLTQLRLAETEKYAHVTYFFNGGREDVFPGEDRKLIPSDRSVATYDLAPADARATRSPTTPSPTSRAGAHDVIIMNYANADMVGPHRRDGRNDRRAARRSTRARPARATPFSRATASSRSRPTTATPRTSSTRTASR